MNDVGANDPAAASPLAIDAAIEAYEKNVDRTLLRENLKLTHEQRVRRLVAFMRFAEQLRDAGRQAS